jgi:ubiquinone biosynthesis protein
MLIRKMGSVSRTYRHINRYRQILTIFFKYGFGDLLNRIHVGQYLETGMQMISRSRRERMEKLTRFERIRMAVEELGPTFVKLAQILSTRPDLIPSEFVDELAKLQDQVPSFPFLQVKEIVEAELNAPLVVKFPQFEEKPLAAASIGQVHRAQLPSGEEVVVKVQRPRIRKTIEADLEILYHLATLIERHMEEWGIQRPTRIVEEFARTMEKEIDYEIEAAHAERFARQFMGNPAIRVPRIYRGFSTARVLTMEYIQGIKVSEISTLQKEGLDRKVIAASGANLILKQIFQFGFFHADPHPGNIFILPDNVICYLDFGMMGSVDRQGRENFADIVFGYLRQDESRIAQALLKIVEWDAEPNRRRLEKDIADFLEIYRFQSLKELQVSGLLKQLIELLTRHRLRFPPDIFLMIKAMATTEGVGIVLDSEFDMVAKAAPFIESIMLGRMHPRRIIGEFFDSGMDLLQLVKLIPGETSEILRQIKEGRVRIGFEHRGLEDFAFHLDRSSNRIAFALIISSLIIGSSLIIRSNIGPYLFGFPILGLLGFSIAGIFGIGLLISILRLGRL